MVGKTTKLDKAQLRAELQQRRLMTQAERRWAVGHWGGSAVVCLLFTLTTACNLVHPRSDISRILGIPTLLILLFMTLSFALGTYVRFQDWQYGRVSQIIRQHAGNKSQAQ